MQYMEGLMNAMYPIGLCIIITFRGRNAWGGVTISSN
jgi:hypothetical protein